MIFQRAAVGVALCSIFLSGCSDGQSDTANRARRARDLKLAPTDSTFGLNDRPPTTPAADSTLPVPERAPAPPDAPQPRPLAVGAIDKPRPDEVLTLDLDLGAGRHVGSGGPSTRLGSGTYFPVELLVSVSTKDSEVGDSVRARVPRDILSVEGGVGIPAGAVLRGRISKIEPAPSGNVYMSIAFTRIDIEGVSHQIHARAFNIRGRALRAEGDGHSSGGASPRRRAVLHSGSGDIYLEPGDSVNTVLMDLFQPRPPKRPSF